MLNTGGLGGMGGGGLNHAFNVPEFHPFSMFHNMASSSSHSPGIRIFTHSPMNQFQGNIDIEQLFSAFGVPFEYKSHNESQF